MFGSAEVGAAFRRLDRAGAGRLDAVPRRPVRADPIRTNPNQTPWPTGRGGVPRRRPDPPSFRGLPAQQPRAASLAAEKARPPRSQADWTRCRAGPVRADATLSQ